MSQGVVAPGPSGQQTNPGPMATEDTGFIKCNFCKMRIEGDNKIRGLYNHVKLAHPEEKSELNFLAVKITEDGMHVQDSSSIQLIMPEPEHSLSVYDNCTFCSSTFSGAQKKTDFYLHIKTKHVDVYRDEWEKLLKIEKAAKKNPESDLQKLREQIDKLPAEVKRSSTNGAQQKETILPSTRAKSARGLLLNLTDKEIEERDKALNAKVEVLSVITSPDKPPGETTNKAPKPNEKQQKQTILPSTRAKSARALLLNLTDEEIKERDKALNAKVEVLSVTTSADKPPGETTNKAPKPNEKQQKQTILPSTRAKSVRGLILNLTDEEIKERDKALNAKVLPAPADPRGQELPQQGHKEPLKRKREQK